MYRTCRNCAEKIQPDNIASNGYIHTKTQTDQCCTAGTARATLGIRVWESDDDILFVVGSTEPRQVYEASKRYYQEVNGVEPAGLNVIVYSMERKWIDPNKSSARKVKVVILPDADDLDGYEAMLTYDWRQ